MLSDEWLPRYRLLENFNIKWNGNGNGNAHGNGNVNAYDRGDYNSSIALRAVELKIYFNPLFSENASKNTAFFFKWQLLSDVTTQCQPLLQLTFYDVTICDFT